MCIYIYTHIRVYIYNKKVDNDSNVYSHKNTITNCRDNNNNNNNVGNDMPTRSAACAEIRAIIIIIIIAHYNHHIT